MYIVAGGRGKNLDYWLQEVEAYVFRTHVILDAHLSITSLPSYSEPHITFFHPEWWGHLSSNGSHRVIKDFSWDSAAKSHCSSAGDLERNRENYITVQITWVSFSFSHTNLVESKNISLCVDQFLLLEKRVQKLSKNNPICFLSEALNTMVHVINSYLFLYTVWS